MSASPFLSHTPISIKSYVEKIICNYEKIFLELEVYFW
jgi:hypothetical protein